MTPKDLLDDTMICYRGARRVATWAPILFLLVVQGRAWALGSAMEFWHELIGFGFTALIWLVAELRCEIIRSDIRRQRMEDGF